MIFSSIDFLFFFVGVLFVLKVLETKAEISKRTFLLIASYYFYGYWNWRFLPLIFFMTGINYFAGKKIHDSDIKQVQQRWLVVSVVASLWVLGVFKYYNFFIDSLHTIFPLSRFPLRTLDIILPLGVSFFTFKAMSYTIDIYRKQIQPCSFLDFALFIVFFPQLLSGPIARASEFLPQLKNRIVITRQNLSDGSRQFVIGFFKKSLLADSLAIFVNEVFNNIALFDGWTIALAVIAYSIQIYCDFSGYSDMAIGAGRVLGFELPLNFNHPYKSRNVSEFWRRWHISLSSWFRDYLYIPLGGSRKGEVRAYINLFSTMTLCGLWHGASWNFVIWGMLHGMALLVHRVYKKVAGKEKNHENQDPFTQPFSFIKYLQEFSSILVTYIAVCIGWIFFRAPDLESVVMVVNRIISGAEGIRWIHVSFYLIAPWFFIWHMIPNDEVVKQRLIGFDSYGRLTLFIAMVMMIFLFSPIGSSPFIYFQF